mmetsp:Transcript_14087/g.31881  ORF Transcript_14087/g.31881 Transcript_14087/m.31881 type:complete len:224 (+) Transcript_14087:1024-1695(+)
MKKWQNLAGKKETRRPLLKWGAMSKRQCGKRPRRETLMQMRIRSALKNQHMALRKGVTRRNKLHRVKKTTDRKRTKRKRSRMRQQLKRISWRHGDVCPRKTLGKSRKRQCRRALKQWQLLSHHLRTRTSSRSIQCPAQDLCLSLRILRSLRRVWSTLQGDLASRSTQRKKRAETRVPMLLQTRDLPLRLPVPSMLWSSPVKTLRTPRVMSRLMRALWQDAQDT